MVHKGSKSFEGRREEARSVDCGRKDLVAVMMGYRLPEKEHKENKVVELDCIPAGSSGSCFVDCL